MNIVAACAPRNILAILVVTIMSLSIVTSLHADEVIVPAGSNWKYLDNGTDQGTAWQDPAFDDSTWASGPAQLGYGDGDEATVVSFGPDSSNKYITTYFRHTFNIADLAAIPFAMMHIQFDDGAVVYLNGIEIHRVNMPTGPITYLTRASANVSGGSEDTFFEVIVDESLLVEGDNVLAVEIHQDDPGSSDISFDLDLICWDGRPSLKRGPYLQNGIQTEMTVRWRTNVATDSIVRYGLAPDQLDQVTSDAAAVLDHEIRLTGLQPGTTYYYEVADSLEVFAGGDADHRFVTMPPAGQVQPIRIWALGDSGTADSLAASVRDAFLAYNNNLPPDVFLMLGDNAYGSGTDEQYQVSVFDMYPSVLRTTSLWPTMGNHDAFSANSPTETGPYYDMFSLPRAGEAGGLPSGTEAYYSFDYGNIHFICLDSADTDLSPTGAMVTWLNADLADTLADWVIAFWHHPPYTKGSHDSDVLADSEGRMHAMRENVLPFLERSGVDLVLSGHSHSYERSFLIGGHYGLSTTVEPTMIFDGRDGQEGSDGPYRKPSLGMAPHEGAVYIVAGSSGKVSGGPLNHPIMYTAWSRLGSLVIDVNDQRLDLSFLDSVGGVLDSFTILKGEEPTPCLNLEVDQLNAGQTSTFTVSGGDPGEEAVILWSNRAGGYVLDNGDWCSIFGFNVPNPTTRVVATGFFNDSGSFSSQRLLPPNARGFRLALQAAQGGTCPAACMSTVIEAIIQ